MYYMGMGTLNKDDVVHVAKLAKLTLTDSEIEKFKSQLSKVISYISELSQVDTKKDEPTSQTTGLENIKRKDEVKPQDSLSQEEALSGTDKTHNGYFIVPGILEERSDK